MAAYHLENVLKVRYMFVHGSWVPHQIIKLCLCKFYFLQDRSPHPLKRILGVHQSNLHNLELIGPGACDKSCVPVAASVYHDFPVPGKQVLVIKILASYQAIENVFNS